MIHAFYEGWNDEICIYAVNVGKIQSSLKSAKRVKNNLRIAKRT
jgi:hypothetical protein